MASQQDLQDLLRLLTVVRRVPMMQAMSQVKALQGVDLFSIKQIAEAELAVLTSAIADEKAAKGLQSECKSALKKSAAASTGTKRSATSDSPTSAAKRSKTHWDRDPFGGPLEVTAEELESSLELPLCMDEARIADTVLWTNRAPLVLAFAVELLRYTMPEQPLSSRLSLAQAVVSANSRTKAVSLGLEKGISADEEGWGEGQPKVVIMGREVTVLKRGGYQWSGEESVGHGTQPDEQEQVQESEASSSTASPSTWAVSQPISLKSSTFVARAAGMANCAQKDMLLRALLEANPKLKTATHNAWAYRLRSPTAEGSERVREDSFDDGETGAGGFLLRIMREADAVDTLVVMSRWFGGTMLGPDRWRLMRNVVTAALAERLHSGITLAGEALWGLDLEAMRSGGRGRQQQQQQQGATGVVGFPIHRAEGARSYLLKSFADGSENQGTGKSVKKSNKALEGEKKELLGMLLGAIRLVLDSWADHVTATELDKKAWSWYVRVRPDVEAGPSGWGAKGSVALRDILNLRRTE